MKPAAKLFAAASAAALAAALAGYALASSPPTKAAKPAMAEPGKDEAAEELKPDASKPGMDGPIEGLEPAPAKADAKPAAASKADAPAAIPAKIAADSDLETPEGLVSEEVGAGEIERRPSAGEGLQPSFGGQPHIQVVFALDTTGSMTGLIEGAKAKIFSIAGEILETREEAVVELGLIAYRDRSDAYVTQTYDLTTDIHAIYGHLRTFRAQGGGDRPESVNQALYEAVTQVSWDRSPSTLRLVFLVGDSPPHMDYEDDVRWPQTCRMALDADIVLNTVLAGGKPDTRQVWQDIADCGGGAFAEIPQDGGMQVVYTPYDDKIDALQRKIADTVLPYGGREEQAGVFNKLEAAAAAPRSVSSDMAAVRMKKGKVNQVLTGGNDLVEDLEDGKVKLDALPEDELPAAIRDLPAEARKDAVDAKVAERAAINAEMDDLVKKREEFIEAERKRLAAESGADAFDITVTGAIREQARAKGIEYKD